MAVSVRKRAVVPKSGDGNSPSESRFDRRLSEILEHATSVFYEKGYEGASMRDLSRSSGMSLAGLYYYFESKEKLLYLVQRHAFFTILEQLRERLSQATDPEQRLRVFIHNHLEYFLANLKAMTVLSHEDEALKNGLGNEIRAMKREYYNVCLSLIEDLRRTRGLAAGITPRIAVMSLFGMMNWIYTWHHPRTDGQADDLARQMGDIFLKGILPAGAKPARNGSSARKKQVVPA